MIALFSPPLSPPAPTSSSSTASHQGSAALCDLKTLLQRHEVGAAVLQVMFTIRRLDRELHGEKPASGKAPIRGGQADGADGPSRMAGGERLTQNLARELFDALGTLDAFSGGQHFKHNMKQIYDAKNLTALLASNVSAKAIEDDHTTAEAVQDEEELPPETICQTLVQRADFAALLRGENADLTSNRCQAVIWALARQWHVDVNRESFARKNGGSNVDKTNCQILFEHHYFENLFGATKVSYGQKAHPEPVVDWNVPWWGSKEPAGNAKLPRYALYAVAVHDSNKSHSVSNVLDAATQFFPWTVFSPAAATISVKDASLR